MPAPASLQVKPFGRGTITDYGDKVRIEETAMAVRKQPILDASGKPAKTITGEPIYEHVPNDKPTWNVYELVENKPMPGATDPDLKQQAYHGGPTYETHTWLHRQETPTVQAADAFARKLAGA
jgi:hypothetical protein